MLLLARETFLFILTIGGLALPFMRVAHRYDLLQRLGLGLAAALVTIYLFATLLYLTGADPRWHWLLPFAALWGGIFSRQEMSGLWHNPAIRAAGLGWLILAAWCLGFTALIASHAGGGWAGDWHEHYERSRFFLEHWPEDHRFITIYPLPARPPLANLVTTGLLALGRPDYSRYQVISCLLATLVCFPLLTVCRLFGGGLVATALIVPALMLNPLFLQNATFPWTKLPSAFFVLTAMPLLVRSLREPEDRWHLPLAASALAAGVLAHYSGAVWMVALSAGWLLAGRGGGSAGKIIRRIAGAGLAASLMLATWFGWALARYGAGLTFGSNTAVEAGRQGNVSDILLTFAGHLLHTLVPHPLLGTSEPALLQADRLATVSDWFFHLYQETLPLTLGGAGLLLIVMIWVRRPSASPAAQGRERLFWWGALPLAGLLGVGTHTPPSVWGQSHISLQPVVLLGLVWLIAYLPEHWPKFPPWVRLLALVLAAVDFAGGIVLRCAVQNDVAARFDQLSFVTRTNYAGKLRLAQPFLADTLTIPGWIIAPGLAALFALACWRVAAARQPPAPASSSQPEVRLF